jgi:hypothetical protein
MSCREDSSGQSRRTAMPMDRRMLLDLGLANGASASGVSSWCGRTFEPEITSHIVEGEMRRLEQVWAGTEGRIRVGNQPQ